MTTYLGIDLGTSSSKVVIMDENQKILASATRPMDVTRPHHGWSEQEPGQWVAATTAAIDELKEKHGAALSRVRGIGLSGHMHGATLLDSQDRVLRPCILWNDTRSHAEAPSSTAEPLFRAADRQHRLSRLHRAEAALGARATSRRFSPRSQGAAAEGLSAPLADRRACRRRCRMPPAPAGSIPAQRDWSDDLLAATGLTASHMPRLVEGTDRLGHLARRNLPPAGACRRAWSWPAAPATMRPPACGVGAVRAGEAFVSLGTSGVLFAANDGYQPNPESAVHTFCHALPEHLAPDGRDPVGHRCAELAGGPHRHASSRADRRAWRHACRHPAGDSFLPYLSRRAHAAQRCRRSAARSPASATRPTAPRCTQAVLEGVTFAIRDSRDALAQAGTELDRLLAVGGGSRSRYWLKAIATALDMPVDLPGGRRFRRGLRRGPARPDGRDRRRSAPVIDAACRPSHAPSSPTRALHDAFDAGLRALPRRLPCHQGVPDSETDFFKDIAPDQVSKARTAPIRSPSATTTRTRWSWASGWRTICALPSPIGTPSPGRAATRSAARPSSARGSATRWTTPS